MDFELVVKRRFMCRSLEGREIPQEVLDRLLDLARRRPEEEIIHYERWGGKARH